MSAGCGSGLKSDLGPIYNRAAQHRDPYRNPVIVIPGILGSKLIDQEAGAVVWGAFARDYANPNTDHGAQLLSLPMHPGQPLHALKDGVVPNGALDQLKVSLLGLPVSLNAYTKILGTLGVGGYRDEQLGESGAVDYGDDHYTCFQFDYDWRRDNAENAKRLHQFIVEKKALVQAEIARRHGIKDHEVKFDIIAHSMGGLVARYFLRYGNTDLPQEGALPQVTWAGAAMVDRVILVGTPSAGSINSLKTLVEGISFAPFLPRFGAAILGTMPSIYQLLPRARHGAASDADTGEVFDDLYDPDLWERMQWGLADHDQGRLLARLLPEIRDPAKRRRIALDHQRKCLNRARRFAAALDSPATPPAGLELFLFAGDAIPTESQVTVDPQSGKLTVSAHAPGDGTVLRSSAVMDERVGAEWSPKLRTPIAWDQVHFLFSDHLGMTKDPAFSDNVLYLLLEAPDTRP